MVFMTKKVLRYIPTGIGIFLFGFILSAIIGDWLGGRTEEIYVSYLISILVSLLFLASVIVICTLLIIDNKKT
jgi:predicted MFS family arabinose efflux permease